MSVQQKDESDEILGRIIEEDDDEFLEEEAAETYSFDFNYVPKEVKTYLDRFVIKQDEAKKALAIAICDHYKPNFC